MAELETHLIESTRGEGEGRNYYYILGKKATKAYWKSWGTKKFIKKLRKLDDADWTLFKYNTDKSFPNHLLALVLHYGDFIELSPCEFNKITKKVLKVK